MIALVGGDSLLAKEIRELLDSEKPSPRLELISATVDNAVVVAKAAFMGDQEDESLVMSPLTADTLEGASVAILAGSAASARRAQKLAGAAKLALIDLTGALEEQPDARLRAPSVEASTGKKSGVDTTAIHVIAHPAAIAIAALLAALAKAGTVRRSIVHVFEPASERGRKGLDELRQQTVAVLSFQKLKMDVFDAQIGFNLLARYGEEAEEPLETVEQRMEKHLASLLSARHDLPMPSLRLIQAPVFHGHSFSLWVEFADSPGVPTVESALTAAGIDVRPDDPPSNAKVAGESGLSVGAISPDSNQPRAYWLWAVADNLKLAAENAIAVAKEILG
ncbi:MAG: Asd/ArgC dimerization domain-containing protein [Bryobacteraceae bacterium]